MKTVLLVDDHPMVLQGCRRVLEDAGIEDICEASSLSTAYRLYHRARPQLIILDLSLQGNGLAGLSLISRIRLRDRHTPILVFSMHGDPVIVSRAVNTGATGYLLKDTAPEDFIEAFNKVARGQPYLSHDMALQIAMLGQESRMPQMTQRELQMLSLIAEGKSYGEIAEVLGVSYKTVANSGSQLKTKLGARTLPELIRMAIEFLAASANVETRRR